MLNAGRLTRRHLIVAACTAIAMALVPVPSLAISPDRSLAQLHHTSWTARDGAPEGAQMMTQTSDGFLWFATTSGLFRFDGVRFERYQSSSGEPMPAAFVTAVLALPDNGLMVGWLNGATLLRNGHAEQYDEKSGFPSGAVRGFRVDGSGTLWAAAGSGLGRFDGKRWERVGAEWNFLEPRARTLFVDRDGTLGAFTDSTLLMLPKGAKSFHATGGKSTTYSPIVQSPDGTYFYADVRGIRSIASLNEYDRMDRPWILEPTARGDTQALLADRDGGLWFSSARGVGRFARPGRRKTEVEYFGRRDGLSGDRVVNLIEDRDGSIWVLTVSGLDRFRSSRFTAQTGSEREAYPALMPEPNGAIRFAGVLQDLRELSTDGVVRRIAPIAATCAYRDADGRAWYCSGPIGAKGPKLFREAGARLQEIPLPDETFAGNSIQAVIVDAQGAPWISLERQGIFRRGESGWRLVTELRRDGKLHALVMTTDPRGGVWIGYSYDRVAHWKDGVVRNWIEKKDGLEVGHVLSVLATDRHVLVGGEAGLAVLDGASFRSLAVSNPDVLRGLSGVVETKEGNLWLHSRAGAVLIEAREVQKAIEQRDYVMVYRVFDSEDGLFGKPTGTRCLPSLVAGPDGRLWFGTVSGVYMLDPSKVTLNHVTPAVVIDGALANERLHRSPADLALPALTTALRVDYTATSLIAPRRVLFRYKLDGVDPEWREAGTRRQAFYTNLGPGRYSFHVSAANEDGIWNEEGASFSFTIAPAWYQSRWFYVLCAMLLLAALSLMYRVRVARVRAQIHARLQARLLERERIARELHDTLIQGFQGLILTFDAAMRRIPPGQAPREQMEDALSRADEVLAEGRDRVRGLRESVVYQGDLRAALTDVAEDLAGLHPTTFTVGVHGVERQLHPVALEEVYGIAREALANAFRHAGAQRVDVEVAFADDNLRIRIGDNGKGIDADVLAKGGISGHWGLPGMRERAHKLGGKLSVRSGPGAGTDVEMEIPAAVAFRGQCNDDSWWRRLRRRLHRDADDAE